MQNLSQQKRQRMLGFLEQIKSSSDDMLIDVSDVSTIPVEVKYKIYQSFSALSKETVNNIKSQDIHCKGDIICVIDRYGFYKNAYSSDEVADILEKYDIICYHATKVSSKSMLLSDGLKTNDWSVYCSNLKNAYKNAEFSENKIQEALCIVKSEYNRKYVSYDRNAQLRFFNNLLMFERRGVAAYDQFCENIGGEMARKALKNNYPELYKPLKEKGKGCVVKFRLPFAMIADYDKNSIAYQFVIYYAGVYFWNKEYDIEFDGNTQSDVPPEDILDIIDYDNDVDY